MVFPAEKDIETNGGLNGGLNKETEKLLLLINTTPGIQIKDIIQLAGEASTRAIER